MFKFGTFSVVTGTSKCNAACPYCISRMTPSVKLETMINKRNFRKACLYAKQNGISTVLFTGKGEPLLDMSMLSQYMYMIEGHDFPFIELQTNGLLIKDAPLGEWRDRGMSLISLSVAHPDISMNADLIQYHGGLTFDYWEAVDYIRDHGLSVRINCTVFKGGTDSLELAKEFRVKCLAHEVAQLTFRQATVPKACESKKVADWISARPTPMLDNMQIGFKASPDIHLCAELPHGAKIYDWGDQNVCLNNCVTETTDPSDIRQLIFYPDGKLLYSWNYPGARIL